MLAVMELNTRTHERDMHTHTHTHTVHPLDETCSLLWSKTHAHTSFESFLEEMIAKKRRA